LLEDEKVGFSALENKPDYVGHYDKYENSGENNNTGLSVLTLSEFSKWELDEAQIEELSKEEPDVIIVHMNAMEGTGGCGEWWTLKNGVINKCGGTDGVLGEALLLGHVFVLPFDVKGKQQSPDAYVAYFEFNLKNMKDEKVGVFKDSGRIGNVALMVLEIKNDEPGQLHELWSYHADKEHCQIGESWRQLVEKLVA